MRPAQAAAWVFMAEVATAQVAMAGALAVLAMAGQAGQAAAAVAAVAVAVPTRIRYRRVLMAAVRKAHVSAAAKVPQVPLELFGGHRLVVSLPQM